MQSATEAVTTLMFEIVQPSNVLPTVLWEGFSIIHGIRRAWRLYNQAEKFSNPENLFTILADQGIATIIGGNKSLQFGAQCLMVLRCASDCADGYQEVSRVYQEFLDVMNNQYPLLEEEPWIKQTDSQLISPLALHQVKSTLKNNAQHIERVAGSFFEVVGKFFVLSMHMLEATDSFSCDYSAEEVASNLKKLKPRLLDNTECLLEKIKKDRLLVEKLLQLYSIKDEDSQAAIDTLIESLEAAVQKANAINEEIDQIDNDTTNLVIRAGKEVLFSAFSVLGITSYMPDSLRLPTPNTTPKKETYARYIPDRLITRLDAPKQKVNKPVKREPPPEKLSEKQIQLLNQIM